MSEVRQFTVGAEDDGIRLDRWFKRHLAETSFTTVAKWARTGQLRVDGARATPGGCGMPTAAFHPNSTLFAVCGNGGWITSAPSRAGSPRRSST